MDKIIITDHVAILQNSHILHIFFILAILASIFFVYNF